MYFALNLLFYVFFYLTHSFLLSLTSFLDQLFFLLLFNFLLEDSYYLIFLLYLFASYRFKNLSSSVVLEMTKQIHGLLNLV